MKKYLVILTTLLLIYSTTDLKVFAQSSTPSSTLRDTVKQQVAAEIAQIQQNLTKKAFVGSITAKTDASLTLNTLRSQTRSVNVAPDATIKLSGNKDGTLKDLKIGDLILAMGDADGQNLLTAKRLLVITKPDTDRRQVISGSVTTVSSSSLTINSGSASPTAIKITSDSKYTGKTKISDVKVGSSVIVITTATGEFSSPTAKRIHLVQSPNASPTPTGN